MSRNHKRPDMQTKAQVVSIGRENIKRTHRRMHACTQTHTQRQREKVLPKLLNGIQCIVNASIRHCQ